MQRSMQTQTEMLELRPKNDKLFIGLPKETAFQENRIALTPYAVRTLTNVGFQIVVEAGAGEKSNFEDFHYSEAGAEIAYSKEQVFKADMILKVAPPSLAEIELCRPGQFLVSPIHLPTLSEEFIYRLKQKRVIALAMEYVKDDAGTFPFVRMLSEMAGISAMQTAAELLTSTAGGRGVLLGGISGVPSAKVVILGAGVVAEYASRVALGFGAEVRVFDDNIRKLMRLQSNLGRQVYTATFNTADFERELCDAEVVIGAIHAESGRTPCIVSEDMVRNMKYGAVIIDVSIDQGGCFATSRVTTHDAPTFRTHDVIHYCVPNIAAKVARTGTAALSNILTPILLQASNVAGVEALLRDLDGFRNGVYVYKGSLTNRHLSERFNIKYMDINLLFMSNI